MLKRAWRIGLSAPATPTARSVVPLSLTPPHTTHLPSRPLVTQAILLAVVFVCSCPCPLLWPSLACSLVLSVLSRCPLYSCLLYFIGIVSAQGVLTCSSSSEALEGRAHVFARSRLRPSQSLPCRRASKVMGCEWHLVVGVSQAFLSFGGTVVLGL